MLEQKKLNTFDEIRAFSDPYRIKILNEFSSLNKPATSKQIADIMGDVPSKVYYHIKKLEKYDIIKLHHTEEINGIVAKFYEPTAKEYIINDKSFSDSTLKNNKSKVETLIHNIYKSSEDIFLMEVRKRNKENPSKIKFESENAPADGGWLLTKSAIYLTDEDAKEFNDYIAKFIESHENSSDKNNKKQYHVFVSTVKLT